MANAIKSDTVKTVYTGSQPSMFNYKGEEFILHKNEQYDLPKDCAHVQNLLAQKLLEEVK